MNIPTGVHYNSYVYFSPIVDLNMFPVSVVVNYDFESGILCIIKWYLYISIGVTN